MSERHAEILSEIAFVETEWRIETEYHLHSNDSSDTKENISLSQTQRIQFHSSMVPLHSCWIARNIVIVLEVSRKGMKMILTDFCVYEFIQQLSQQSKKKYCKLFL